MDLLSFDNKNDGNVGKYIFEVFGTPLRFPILQVNKTLNSEVWRHSVAKRTYVRIMCYMNFCCS